MGLLCFTQLVRRWCRAASSDLIGNALGVENLERIVADDSQYERIQSQDAVARETENVRQIPRLNLLGWSWGTALMATYTTQNAQKVERLVLHAPVWIRQTASLVQTGPGPLA